MACVSLPSPSSLPLLCSNPWGNRGDGGSFDDHHIALLGLDRRPALDVSAMVAVTEPPQEGVYRQNQLERLSVKREHNQHT
jgi:hypothetical protein